MELRLKNLTLVLAGLILLAPMCLANSGATCHTRYRSLGEFRRVLSATDELRTLVRTGNTAQRRLAEAILRGLRLYGRSDAEILNAIPRGAFVTGTAAPVVQEAYRSGTYLSASASRFGWIYERRGIPSEARNFIAGARNPRATYTFRFTGARNHDAPSLIESARSYAEGSAQEFALAEALGISAAEFRPVLSSLANFFDRELPFTEVIPHEIASLRRIGDADATKLALLERLQRDYVPRITESMLREAEQARGGLVVFESAAVEGNRIFPDPEGTFGTVLISDGGIPTDRIRMIVPLSTYDLDRLVRSVRVNGATPISATPQR